MCANSCGSGGGSGGWEWGEQATRGPQLYQHQCLCYFAVVTVNKIEPRGMKLSKQVYEISNLLEISSDEYH